MDLNHEPVLTPPRDAASVVLLRDADAGLEVFMVKRHGASAVLGGAYVFPGGKVDPADSEPSALAQLSEPLDRLHAGLGEPQLGIEAAAGIWVAACRETFEEVGVLLSCGATLAHIERAAALLREGHGFADVLATLGLSLDCGNIVPWSRWVTPRVPSVMTKRFDTRLFVVAVPDGQRAVHDDRETVDSAWLTPREALSRYWDGQIGLAPPQIMTMAHLARYRGVAEVLAAARNRLPPLIEPEPFEQDGTRVIAYPGDERHPVRERAMPGPSRLAFRKGRFEPAGGFDAFFG